ncbi:class I SAM-dependent methyltransferase [Salirhabdus salicampi]|uniref:class I SAM-dependent methyltransferase n=1 Tax=Salirhabdus salicampi TaxID=476102 RepID=UPI0020C252B1|nr:class I SAM-dependent methyltransferase [Salirhabdus salicampi]MCP8618055.1 class I SAM-dependent methyltransferase [Salirhabdus salicampi]
MADHYYSKTPNVESKPDTWQYELRGEVYTFTSDRGVFSKGEVDFGSKTLIECFEEPEVTGAILDVGCGYGPIGLSIAKMFPDRHVVMVDVNERALTLAKQNANQNEITNVTISESDMLEGVKNETFAAVITNPPIRAGKQVVRTIMEQSYSVLIGGGELWVVVQKKQGAPSIKKQLENLFDKVVVQKRNKGYYVFRAKKFD